MTISLPLEPQEEIQLAAEAKARGISPELLIGEAVKKILNESSLLPDREKSPGRSVLEIFTEALKDVAPEEFEKLPRDGASEHDHYLYGSPKRNS